ncbi:hypothetical protein M0R45_018207 [Rubus argutus]|uniref:Uncharacterized protein n=1 Tax=Rubus argutus TaxID=59490 RepID=A0AAW1X3I1_RUBAR
MNKFPAPHLILSFLFLSSFLFSLTHAVSGKWQLLLKNVGISAMHMQLLHNDRVVMFDRTDFGKSNLPLPNGRCRNNPNDLVLKVDCTAHSAEYDVASNKIRPLFVYSDVLCSSGSVNSNGTLVQTGGNRDGDRRVRISTLVRLVTGKRSLGLSNRRWYSTNHQLPDGRQIIIGGRSEFNYEFYPKSQGSMNFHNLPFLAETSDATIENNLYPFVFLNVDGNLFIFANNRAILFDYAAGKIVKTYPTIPGGDPRSYPSTGSAVLLPLKSAKGKSVAAEVLVCGGAPKGSYVKAQSGTFVEALKTCARIKITTRNRSGTGTAGFEHGRNPVLNPVVYKPDNAVGSRFEQQNPSKVPRMYHSTAVLLRDEAAGSCFRKCDSGGEFKFEVQVTTPSSGNLAPSGYYLVYVVHQQIPSEGLWVKIK